MVHCIKPLSYIKQQTAKNENIFPASMSCYDCIKTQILMINNKIQFKLNNNEFYGLPRVGFRSELVKQTKALHFIKKHLKQLAVN
jgi:hypothetical protein